MISLQIGAVGGCENAGASPCSCLWVTRVGLGLELELGLSHPGEPGLVLPAGTETQRESGTL